MAEFGMSSQNNEARIVREILERCGEAAEIEHVCCDVGAMDASRYSNVYDLWHNRGWSAVLIERREGPWAKIVKDTEGFPVTAINATVTPNGESGLDNLFRKYSFDPNVGVLSIDIDSFDYYVFKNLSYVRPQIVIIEFNHLIDPGFEYYDPEDQVYLRHSLTGLLNLAEQKGFRPYAVTECNCILVSNAIAQYLGRLDSRIEITRSWREAFLTFLGIALGPDNLYPVFIKPRPRLYRAVIRSVFWAACKLLNWQLVRKMRGMPAKKRFNKPSLSMQMHFEKFGIYV